MLKGRHPIIEGSQKRENTGKAVPGAGTGSLVRVLEVRGTGRLGVPVRGAWLVDARWVRG